MTRRNDWLLGQLPMGMMDDDFFVRFVSIFQEVATTLLEGADNMPNVLDLTVAPAPVVRWLGSWIGVDSIDSSLPEEFQRRLVRQAGQVLAWRGTRRGVEKLLETMTGSPVEIEESGGIMREGEAGDRPPFVRIRVAPIEWMADEDFLKLVADEVPANVTFELFAGDRQLWPVLAAVASGGPDPS